MPVFETSTLLEALSAEVRAIILRTEQLRRLPPSALQQPGPHHGWSVLEVLEHLNFYGRYYLPAIEQRMAMAPAPKHTRFRSGWLGQYFTTIIGPSPSGQVERKLQAPANARPQAAAQLDADEVLSEFLAHQHHLLQLLTRVAKTDLGKVRIPISINRFIRLKLGDTLRFLIAHQQRHFQQIERVLAFQATLHITPAS